MALYSGGGGGDGAAITSPSDVSGSRSSGQTFTNTGDTSRMVHVATDKAPPPLSRDIKAFVDGVQVAVDATQGLESTGRPVVGPCGVTFLVPPGSDYRVDVSIGRVSTWTEAQYA